MAIRTKLRSELKAEPKSDSNVVTKNSLSAEKIDVSSQKNGVCVALNKDKSTTRVEGNSPEDFFDLLKEADIAWVNFRVEDLGTEGKAISEAFGFQGELVSILISSEQYNYDDRDDQLGVKLPAVSVNNLDVTINPTLLLIKKGLILSLHESGVTRLVRFSRYAKTYMRKIAERELWEDKLTILLWRIIDESNSRNFENLRQIEEQADHLVKELMDPTTPRDRLGPHIYKMKHALIVYLDALWMSFDLINNLRYGDAETLSDDPQILDRISALGYDITNQISLSEHMSEVLASGLEVLQSIYNNQLQILNNRLALVVTWLTILGTAVLVPNTIATMFGTKIGDSFDANAMLIILLVSTALAALGSWWFTKKANINNTCYK